MKRVYHNFILWMNERLNRLRTLRAPAGNVLLLVPHCLQRSQCEHNILHNLDNCERCGQCDINEIIRMRDELDIQCNLAGGGEEALAAVRHPSVRLVVAVACERELVTGILAAFPTPVLTVPNVRPHGPCRDTEVDNARLRAVLESVIDQSPNSSVPNPP